jgi:hypothetical protein
MLCLPFRLKTAPPKSTSSRFIEMIVSEKALARREKHCVRDR